MLNNVLPENRAVYDMWKKNRTAEQDTWKYYMAHCMLDTQG
jgi:hypothetical protein